MNRLKENLTIISEGILYYVLLRFLLVGIMYKLIKVKMISIIAFTVIGCYYLLIILIGFYIGRRIARKNPNNKISNALIVSIIYTALSLLVFIWGVNILEFVALSFINILMCVIGAVTTKNLCKGAV